MRILADENVPRAIVVWLRSEGHDVLSASESRVQTPDVVLLAESEDQGYVILTEDKDFGERVFRDRRNSHGVILLRMEQFPPALRLARLQAIWAVIENHMPGQFLRHRDQPALSTLGVPVIKTRLPHRRLSSLP